MAFPLVHGHQVGILNDKTENGKGNPVHLTTDKGMEIKGRLQEHQEIPKIQEHRTQHPLISNGMMEQYCFLMCFPCWKMLHTKIAFSQSILTSQRKKSTSLIEWGHKQRVYGLY